MGLPAKKNDTVHTVQPRHQQHICQETRKGSSTSGLSVGSTELPPGKRESTEHSSGHWLSVWTLPREVTSAKFSVITAWYKCL